jgi:hypothetical protein
MTVSIYDEVNALLVSLSEYSAGSKPKEENQKAIIEKLRGLESDELRSDALFKVDNELGEYARLLIALNQARIDGNYESAKLLVQLCADILGLFSDKTLLIKGLSQSAQAEKYKNSNAFTFLMLALENKLLRKRGMYSGHFFVKKENYNYNDISCSSERMRIHAALLDLLNTPGSGEELSKALLQKNTAGFSPFHCLVNALIVGVSSTASLKVEIESLISVFEAVVPIVGAASAMLVLTDDLRKSISKVSLLILLREDCRPTSSSQMAAFLFRFWKSLITSYGTSNKVSELLQVSPDHERESAGLFFYLVHTLEDAFIDSSSYAVAAIANIWRELINACKSNGVFDQLIEKVFTGALSDRWTMVIVGAAKYDGCDGNFDYLVDIWGMLIDECCTPEHLEILLKGMSCKEGSDGSITPFYRLLSGLEGPPSAKVESLADLLLRLVEKCTSPIASHALAENALYTMKTYAYGTLKEFTAFSCLVRAAEKSDHAANLLLVFSLTCNKHGANFNLSDLDERLRDKLCDLLIAKAKAKTEKGEGSLRAQFLEEEAAKNTLLGRMIDKHTRIAIGKTNARIKLEDVIKSFKGSNDSRSTAAFFNGGQDADGAKQELEEQVERGL